MSGGTYLLEPNPSTVESVQFEFDDSSEATFTFSAAGSPLYAVAVGLDGVYRFTPGPDGRPTAFRGSWLDAQTFRLEYEGITNNDHSLFEFHFEDDKVEVQVGETAHEGVARFSGKRQAR